jgi:hypothetical protein
VLSPAYFLSLQGLFPKVSSIEIQPRWGRIDNEMSVYRYDAILHVGDGETPATPLDFLDWNEQKLTLEQIRSTVLAHHGKIGSQRIQNARLERDSGVFQRLQTMAP